MFLNQVSSGANYNFSRYICFLNCNMQEIRKVTRDKKTDLEQSGLKTIRKQQRTKLCNNKVSEI